MLYAILFVIALLMPYSHTSCKQKTVRSTSANFFDGIAQTQSSFDQAFSIFDLIHVCWLRKAFNSTW